MDPMGMAWQLQRRRRSTEVVLNGTVVAVCVVIVRLVVAVLLWRDFLMTQGPQGAHRVGAWSWSSLGLEFDKELTMHQMHHHKFRLDVT
jgi:hypothetical protein